MTTTTQLKCADRIGEEMKAREEMIQAMTNRAEDSEYYGDEEAIHELALAIDSAIVTTICLSYGGPADYLEITHNKLGDGIMKMTYRYSDWFDTATLEVEEGTALWNYGAMIIDSL